MASTRSGTPSLPRARIAPEGPLPGPAAAPPPDHASGRRWLAKAHSGRPLPRPRHSGEDPRRSPIACRPTRRAAHPPRLSKPRECRYCPVHGQPPQPCRAASTVRPERPRLWHRASRQDYRSRPAAPGPGPCPGHPAGRHRPTGREWLPGHNVPCAIVFHHTARRPAWEPLSWWRCGRAAGMRPTSAAPSPPSEAQRATRPPGRMRELR